MRKKSSQFEEKIQVARQGGCESSRILPPSSAARQCHLPSIIPPRLAGSGRELRRPRRRCRLGLEPLGRAPAAPSTRPRRRSGPAIRRSSASATPSRPSRAVPRPGRAVTAPADRRRVVGRRQGRRACPPRPARGGIGGRSTPESWRPSVVCVWGGVDDGERAVPRTGVPRAENGLRAAPHGPDEDIRTSSSAVAPRRSGWSWPG